MPLLRLLFLLPLVLHAQPGSLLPSSFPDPSSHAGVHATSTADDGSTYLSGDFTEIDGVARPGLAKLTPSGTLDISFTPTATPASDLHSLPTGHLMAIGQDSWTLLNPDGSPNTELFADLPRSSVPRPQFHTTTHLYLIADESLRAYHASDLSRDETFTSPTTTHPLYQAVPTADSKLWLLTRSPSPFTLNYYNSSSTHTLLRLLGDGSVDPAFTPIELPADNTYSLETAPAGGFRLISEWLGRYIFWPSPTNRSLTAARYDSSGEKTTALTYAVPFSWSSRALHLFQDPELVIYPSLDSTRLVRRQATSQTPDPDFSIPIAAPELPIHGPVRVDALDHLPSGKILLGGTRRFLADGTPDPSWHTPRLTRNATISHLHRLPDGSILATGDFDLSDSAPAPGILKLRPDVTPDPSFTPSFDFRFAEKILPFPDGTLLAHFSVPATDPSGRVSQLARFSATGEFLSLWPIPEPPGSATLYFGEVTDFAIQSDGTTLVTTFTNNEVPTYGFRRILPDGSWLLALGTFAYYNTPGTLLHLHDDSYLRGNTHFAADGTLLETIPELSNLSPLVQLPDHSVIFARHFPSIATTSPSLKTPSLKKWHPLTGIDPTFVDPFGGRPGNFIVSAAPAAHDKLVLHKNSTLVRLHATGQIDPSFRPPSGNIHSVLAESGDSLLIAGDFTSIDGQTRSGLARIEDTRAIGFTEWIAAATARSTISDLAPDADPDHDGNSNFLEYAAATDPTIPNSSQPTHLGSLSWMIPCNPEAPEITRRLETSSSLNSWQPARADQIRLETQNHCLSWTLLPGSSNLFSRVKVE